MNRLHRGIALIALGLVAGSCGGKKKADPGTGPVSDLALLQDKDAPDGLELRVSDGQQGPPAYDRAKLAPAKKLSRALRATSSSSLLPRSTPRIPS